MLYFFHYFIQIDRDSLLLDKDHKPIDMLDRFAHPEPKRRASLDRTWTKHALSNFHVRNIMFKPSSRRLVPKEAYLAAVRT